MVQASLFAVPDETPAPSSAPALRVERRKRGRPPGSRTRRVVKLVTPPAAAGPMGVVDQVRFALQPRARLAAAVGMLLGAVVPFVTSHYAHRELDFSRALYLQPLAFFVLGGLLFSAVTMYSWGRLAFLDRAKALGFVVLLEGTMITSHTAWLANVALAYLIAINGVATACNLAQKAQAA
jgi:hypothetical protein